MNPKEQMLIAKIKQLSYEEMLYISRHTTGDNAYLHGEVGQFFVQRLAFQGSQLGDEEKKQISEQVGW